MTDVKAFRYNEIEFSMSLTTSFDMVRAGKLIQFFKRQVDGVALYPLM